MENTIVYVDSKLILPAAAKLVGSATISSNSKSKKGGFNWFANLNLDYTQNSSIETRTADLFPEDVLIAVYREIEHRGITIKEMANRIQSNKIKTSDVIGVNGVLKIGHKFPKMEFDPFDPPDIKLEKRYNIGGHTCFLTELIDEGFRIPLFFQEDALEVACYCHSKPIEVIGVVRWSPPYEIGGYIVNQRLLGISIFLRR